MQTVIGLFENAHDAQQAAQQLMSSGFTSDNVDVSVRGNNTSSDTYMPDTSASAGSNTLTGTADTAANTLSGSDTYGATGSSTTGAFGSDASSGSDAYGSGSSSGSDLYGSGSSSNVRSYDHDDSFGDKVSKFFKNLFGGDDDEADRYSHVASKTGCVVTVYADSKQEAERAADILDNNGAIDVDKSATEYGYSGTSGRMNSGDTEGSTLNVIKEDVQVGKREVETGGVRLRSRIVERPVEQNIRLREERINIERTPVDRPATTADFQNFKEGEIEMTEYAEVPEVTKQARVVEEVKVSKEVNERTETINETARDTEVDVENVQKKDVTNKKNKSL